MTSHKRCIWSWTRLASTYDKMLSERMFAVDPPHVDGKEINDKRERMGRILIIRGNGKDIIDREQLHIVSVPPATYTTHYIPPA